jgi:hypothetical protein
MLAFTDGILAHVRTLSPDSMPLPKLNPVEPPW